MRFGLQVTKVEQRVEKLDQRLKSKKLPQGQPDRKVAKKTKQAKKVRVCPRRVARAVLCVTRGSAWRCRAWTRCAWRPQALKAASKLSLQAKKLLSSGNKRAAEEKVCAVCVHVCCLSWRPRVTQHIFYVYVHTFMHINIYVCVVPVGHASRGGGRDRVDEGVHRRQARREGARTARAPVLIP